MQRDEVYYNCTGISNISTAIDPFDPFTGFSAEITVTDKKFYDQIVNLYKGGSREVEKKEKTIKKVPKEFQIKQVIFNENKKATTVLFEDGKHIVVKRSENDYDPSDIYNVVAYAIAKKIYGSNSAFKKSLKEKTTLIVNKKKIKVDPDTLEV